MEVASVDTRLPTPTMRDVDIGWHWKSPVTVEVAVGQYLPQQGGVDVIVVVGKQAGLCDGMVMAVVGTAGQ